MLVRLVPFSVRVCLRNTAHSHVVAYTCPRALMKDLSHVCFPLPYRALREPFVPHTPSCLRFQNKPRVAEMFAAITDASTRTRFIRSGSVGTRTIRRIVPPVGGACND